MRTIVSMTVLGMMACGTHEQWEGGGNGPGIVSEQAAEKAKETRRPGLYSDTLSARMVANNRSLGGNVYDLHASAGGERVFLSMGEYTCSMTEYGTVDYDVDVDPAGTETDAETGDTGTSGELGTGDETVVGTGEEEWMLVSADNALYRVNVVEDITERLTLSGVVAGVERAGLLSTLDADGLVSQRTLDGAVQWETQLDTLATQMVAAGDDLLLAGDLVQRVDRSGRVTPLDYGAERIAVDGPDVFAISNGAVVARDEAGDVRWSFDDGGLLSDLGVLPGRSLVWAHFMARHGESQVVLLDARDGAVIGELVVSPVIESVASSADGDTIAIASRKRVSIYRFDD